MKTSAVSTIPAAVARVVAAIGGLAVVLAVLLAEIFALAEIFSSDHFHGKTSPTLVICQDKKKVWRRLLGCCGGRGCWR